ncbi:MAG: glycosyltransferase [Oscillatoriales cyanobacterium C42_A2020_001]|nr:glycosyltransferase [Leptolyngbyaceae cyanobacterium C42_A2020_001]
MSTMNAPPQFPSIAPVPKGVHRPRWSVMIPTYNCAEYLKQTLESVLSQAPDPDVMQIEVVDDCSTQDDPEAVVQTVGQGRVSFYRQPQNGGAIHNFNTCIQRSTGHLLHILHGDDKVLPGFYSAMEQAFQTAPDIGAAFCRPIYIDEVDRQRFIYTLEQPEAGIMPHLLQRLGVVCMIQTPSIAVRRSVYEAIGGFHPDLFHAGDWEMWKRVASYYPVWYEPQPLACYRTHSSSHTSSLVRTAANIANTRRAIKISEAYLPASIRADLTHQANEFYAMYAFETACWQLIRRNPTAAIAQFREALKCSHSPKTLTKMVHFATRASFQRGSKLLSTWFKPSTALQP